MVTIEIVLTEEQALRLLQRADRHHRTVSEHVTAIDAQVEEWEWEQRQERVKQLREIAGTGGSGVTDVAERHDEYFVEAILSSDEPGEEPNADTDGPDEVG